MTLNGVSIGLALQHDCVWLDAPKYYEAERQYYELQARRNQGASSECIGQAGAPSMKKVECCQIANATSNSAKPSSSIASEIAHARQKIQNFLKSNYQGSDTSVLVTKLNSLEQENLKLKQEMAVLCAKMDEICLRTVKLEAMQQTRHMDKKELLAKLTDVDFKSSEETNVASKIFDLIDKTLKEYGDLDLEKKENKKVTVAKPDTKSKPANDDDDDIDLFGSDEETEDDIRIREERLKAYENKKAKKPALVAKSSVVLDVKPWSDETDMKQVEAEVRKIELDGLKWGAGKLVPLAYGINKLQIIAIVEDDKVSIDWLQESIEGIEDFVQSVDIAAFNKL